MVAHKETQPTSLQPSLNLSWEALVNRIKISWNLSDTYFIFYHDRIYA